MKILYLSLLLIICPNAFATKTNSPIIKQVENYFSSFENLQAKFTQNGQDQTRSGILYITKPGKFRWEYSDGKLLIVSTGDTIIYADHELETTHYISADDTVADMLSHEKLDLTNGDYKVDHIVANHGEISVLIHNSKKEDIGKLNLIFGINPFTLKRIEIIDTANNLVEIELSEVSYPEKLDPELFNYYEDHNKRW